ncbi:MAG: hypothetical protein HYY40_11030 [Bacteroidetes bacterium]|nr:hypothetical protein [Bacteroidota bacterium]
MRRTILLTLNAIFIFFDSFGQDYLGDKKADIIIGLNDSTYKISFTQTVVQVDTFWYQNDTVTHLDTIVNLKVSVNGFEKIELEYFFDQFDNLCDSIEIKYYCSQCVDKHIKELLVNKERKWRQLDKDNYISRRQTTKTIIKDPTTSRTVTKVGSPYMTIKRTVDNPVCATIYFYIPMMDKDKWRQLTKK